MTNRQLDVLINVILDKVNEPVYIQQEKNKLQKEIESSKEYKELENLLIQQHKLREQSIQLQRQTTEIANAIRVFEPNSYNVTLSGYLAKKIAQKDDFTIKRHEVEQQIVLLKSRGLRDAQLIDGVIDSLKK